MFSVGWAFGYATGYAHNATLCDVAPAVWPVQSLAREVKYDPRLQQLVFEPLPEMLHGLRMMPPALVYDFNAAPVVVAPGGWLPLVNDSMVGAGKVKGYQMELQIYFARPAPSTRDRGSTSTSNDSLGGTTGSGDVGTSTRFGVRVLKNCNLENCDFFTVVELEFPDESSSEGILTVDARRGNSRRFNSNCIDAKSPSVFSGPFRLLPHEKLIELRVLVDRNIVEAFVQGGRTAVSAVVAPNSTTANADIFHGLKEANAAEVKVVNATVHGMGCMWET